ncbi:MAG: hypothetical protein ACN4GW_07155 [Desulforhopalus sp.]
MSKLNTRQYIGVCTFFCHLFFLSSQSIGQDTLGSGIDCTDVRVDYSDDPGLTQEERLRLMDKAFFESLDRFEYCQQARKNNKAKDAGGSGEGAGEPGGNSGGGSVASSTMSGTESVRGESSTEQNGEERSGSVREAGDQNETGSNSGRKTRSSSGKIPEDIPSAENDDILAAQIRYAAEQETDPVKKKQLWNEYRKYKGLAPR